MVGRTYIMRGWRLLDRGQIVVICAVLMAIGTTHNMAYAGVTAESPEVKKLVNAGLAYLEKNTDQRLGGRCLIGLAFLKAGRSDHKRVAEAIEACYETTRTNPDDDNLDVYSNGLAVVFLSEVGAQQYGQQLKWFLDRLKKRQKDHGGWGYHTLPTGDTSQTQCVALGYWEANRHGIALDRDSIDRLADWLARTQGPAGEWGYQGNVTKSESSVEQQNVSCAMVAAGLGSTYICAELFGLRERVGNAAAKTRPGNTLPAALRPVDNRSGGARVYRPQLAGSAKIGNVIARGHGWFAKNYTIDLDSKSYYYLYSLERFKSFQEEFENLKDDSPKWYNDGFNYLAKHQSPDGSWSGFCGTEVDTAFASLFLLRSTKKSMGAKLSEGMLLAGRGLPANLSRAKLRNGELIVDQVHTKVDQLLTMIDDGNDAVLDDLARDPSQLVVDQVDEKSARRLQQLVRGGEPEVRILAVRTLGRTGNLDYVPTLLYALTDPDRRVVIEARDELKFISRNFEGLGPPNEFNEQQRYEAVDAWKKWYLSIRPTAVLEQP